MAKLNESYKKDLKKVITKIDRQATYVSRTVLADMKNKFVSFDETEVIPFSAGPTGQITLSGTNLEDSDTSLEAILAKETDKLTEIATHEFTKSVKEVFK